MNLSEKRDILVNNRTKIMVLAIFFLCFLGISTLFGQEKCIESMDELFPELKWLNNRDQDGVELPTPKQENPKDLLDGFEIPPQRPKKRFGRD